MRYISVSLYVWSFQPQKAWIETLGANNGRERKKEKQTKERNGYCTRMAFGLPMAHMLTL
jgi:hypothetical protein